MNKSIAIVGQGFVGGSLTTVMSERGFEVYTFDKLDKVAVGGKKTHVQVERGSRHAKTVKEFVSACENVVMDDVRPRYDIPAIENFTGVYFVCVPTPMCEDGSADVSIVESVLEELASVAGERIAVVKSTVPPGSTKRWNERFNHEGLRIVFNPEFLREASALDDMRNQDRIILGGPKKAVNVVRDVYRAAFPNVDVHKTSSTNGEFVKYTANCALAVKLSFANELYQTVNKFDPEEADYDRIVELATLDKRLGDSHWKVPGPMTADDGSGRLLPGWGGSCFWKDMNAFMNLATKLGVDPKVVRAAIAKNVEVRPGRDWEKLVGRAVKSK